MGRSRLGVVLFQLGGPDSLDAVRPFLRNLFRDPDMIDIPLGFMLLKPLASLVSRKRAPVVASQYRTIGSRSPLGEITLGQARALESTLGRTYEAKVVVGMRYWKPSIEEALRDLHSFAPERVVLLPLFPQYSRTTTGSCFKEWERCKKASALSFHREERIDSFCDHPLFVRALVGSIRRGLEFFEARQRSRVHILFSAHGLPVRYVRKGDPYEGEVQRTVESVIASLGEPNPNSLAYQSRVGPLKWLAPSIEEEVRCLAGRGVKELLVVPVSFVSDHLETLYTLGIELRGHARSLGIENFHVAPALNDSQGFIGALDKLVREKAGEGE